MLTEVNLLMLLCFFVVAFLYGSVGHGGASGYLAIMALFSLDPSLMRSSALILNLFVAGIAFVNFRLHFQFRWKLFLPLILGSIPLAYLGATLNINPITYKVILGLVLLLAVARLIYRSTKEYELRELPSTWLLALLGMAIGFLSGLIGIGGGILLSPLLIFFRWEKNKETALYSSLFILLNSISGLSGLGLKNIHLSYDFTYWILAAILGGLLGSWSASSVLPVKYFRLTLAVVLLIACYKLILV